MKFEYRIVVRAVLYDFGYAWEDTGFRDRKLTGEQLLNELGSQGWELVSIVPIAHRVGSDRVGIDGATKFIHYVFKRQS